MKITFYQRTSNMPWSFCSGHFSEFKHAEYKSELLEMITHLPLWKMTNVCDSEEYVTSLRIYLKPLFLTDLKLTETCLLLILWVCKMSACLIEGSSTVLRSTQAGDLLILNREFVIISNLFIYINRLPRVDDYLLLSFDGDDFGIAVWLWKEKHIKPVNIKC